MTTIDSNSDVFFAVVGVGNIGTRHIAHINAHAEARLAAVLDIDPKRCQPFEQQTGVVVAQSFEELIRLSNVDVVSICTPNYLHAPMTIAALQAGKHVVCEKPMALSTVDCQQMIAAAEIANKKLFVVKQNRYNPPVVLVKQLLTTGRLGNVYQVVVNCFWNRNDAYYQQSDWRGTKDKDGGCLFTQCSHFVDIMYYLFGSVMPLSGIIRNFAHPNTVAFEDSGAFVLKTDSGAIVSFNFSTCTYRQNMEGSITLIAEKGTIKIGGQYLNAIEYVQIEGEPLPHLPESNTANDYGSYKGSMSNHDKVIQNVIDTLHGRDQIATNGEEGKQIIGIIENMYSVCDM